MLHVLRKSIKHDIAFLAENAREADRIEVCLLGGKTIHEALTEDPNLIDHSFTWEAGGKIVCMYGVNPTGKKVGVLWMLATDEFENHTKDFVHECKIVFNRLIDDYDYLFNYVHSKHEKAIKWLKWLGCKVYDPEPIGIKGDLFCRFEVGKCVIQ